MKINKYKIKIKYCGLCGKKFPVKIKYPEHLIVSECWHNYLRKYYFMGWSYRVIDFKTIETKRIYKNKFYEIVGFCKISRKIVYWIWKLFHRGTEEFWECPECCGDYNEN